MVYKTIKDQNAKNQSVNSSNNSKAKTVASMSRNAVAAERNPAAAADDISTTATLHAKTAIFCTIWICFGAFPIIRRVIPIPTPLKHIPAHVIYSQFI